MKNYTYDDEGTYILDDLIRFADHNRSMDRKFIDDAYDFMDEYGYLTEKQMEILTSLYKNNKVEEYFNRFE